VLSAAFVTTFAQRLTREGEASAWRLASLVVNTLAIVVGGLTLVGMWLPPAPVHAIPPGLRQGPGQAELPVHPTRIMCPCPLRVTCAAVGMGVLNARDVSGVPASASAFFNLGSIVGGVAAAWYLAPGYLTAATHDLTSVDHTLAARAMAGMAVGTL